jgi:ubiquinone/menaquinone biosynthesis C-methylase UbiE
MLSVLRKYIPGRPPIGGKGPRGFVGGLWHEVGELQFRFLVDHGLEPRHTLLDIACGSLRAGVRMVPYLDPGNYLGIDIDASLIDHGKTVELGDKLIAIKQPEFVVSGAFEFDRFSRRPDFAMAQSLFTHLTVADIGLCLHNLRAVAKPDTVLFATFFEVAQPFANPAQSHPHAAFRYTPDEMRRLGDAAGLRMDYIGDWSHPRDQKMLRYSL